MASDCIILKLRFSITLHNSFYDACHIINAVCYEFVPHLCPYFFDVSGFRDTVGMSNLMGLWAFHVTFMTGEAVDEMESLALDHSIRYQSVVLSKLKIFRNVVIMWHLLSVINMISASIDWYSIHFFFQLKAWGCMGISWFQKKKKNLTQDSFRGLPWGYNYHTQISWSTLETPNKSCFSLCINVSGLDKRSTFKFIRSWFTDVQRTNIISIFESVMKFTLITQNLWKYSSRVAEACVISLPFIWFMMGVAIL